MKEKQNKTPWSMLHKESKLMILKGEPILTKYKDSGIC